MELCECLCEGDEDVQGEYDWRCGAGFGRLIAEGAQLVEEITAAAQFEEDVVAIQAVR